MAVDECCGSVVFTEQAAVDVVEPVPGHEPVPAGGTCETLEWQDREAMTTSSIPLRNNTFEQTHMLMKGHTHITQLCVWGLDVVKTVSKLIVMN